MLRPHDSCTWRQLTLRQHAEALLIYEVYRKTINPPCTNKPLLHVKSTKFPTLDVELIQNASSRDFIIWKYL